MKLAYKWKRQYWPPMSGLDKEKHPYYLHEGTGVYIERKPFRDLHSSGWLWNIYVPVEGPVTPHNWDGGYRWVYTHSEDQGWSKAEAQETASLIIQEILIRRYSERG